VQGEYLLQPFDLLLGLPQMLLQAALELRIVAFSIMSGNDFTI
jgi:hypothetical protein